MPAAWSTGLKEVCTRRACGRVGAGPVLTVGMQKQERLKAVRIDLVAGAGSTLASKVSRFMPDSSGRGRRMRIAPVVR